MVWIGYTLLWVGLGFCLVKLDQVTKLLMANSVLSCKQKIDKK